jgi:hypothetical protein
MANAKSRPDVDFFMRTSLDLHDQHPELREWPDSAFDWTLRVATGTRGAIGRQLAEAWIASMGIPTGRLSEYNRHYVLAWNYRIQVKTSTLWDSGNFRFQQIRDQNYDFLLCLGLMPTDVSAWLIPKQTVIEHLDGVGGQHTGASARETLWMNPVPGANGTWIDEYGDQLSDVRQLLLQLPHN